MAPVLGLLTLLLGLGAFGVGFSLLRKRRRWLAQTARTVGQVQPGGHSLLYEVAGKTYRLSLPARGHWGEGAALPVLYARAQPAQARVQSTGGVWLAPVFFMLLGAALLLYGLSLLV